MKETVPDIAGDSPVVKTRDGLKLSRLDQQFLERIETIIEEHVKKYDRNMACKHIFFHYATHLETVNLRHHYIRYYYIGYQSTGLGYAVLAVMGSGYAVILRKSILHILPHLVVILHDKYKRTFVRAHLAGVCSAKMLHSASVYVRTILIPTHYAKNPNR